MKLLLLSVLLLNSLFAFEYTLSPTKVNSNTYCFFGLPEVMNEKNNGNISNSCYVNMGDSYIVIDSGPSYLYAKSTHANMKEIKDLPISYLINTHGHDDHYLGNAYYKEIGVEIVGSKEFKNVEIVQETRMQSRISKEAYAGTKQVFPSTLVDGTKVLELNGIKVYLEAVDKRAHSNSDIFIHIPKYETIFAGDLVFSERIPVIRDGNLNNWIEALEKIKTIKAKHIIGGHGEIVDKSSIDSTYNYIKTLRDKVAFALEDGDELDDAVNNIKMEDFKEYKTYSEQHKPNVAIAYRKLEWEQ
ncbi:MBL fold metallo-hydrolase [Candidatus Sulfurimonas marisnigri]|uniref:MBL fold metallo-hydrolase n=1 Tax=Candidatus Sulfurimonas marisnigri TaxID=2740405 RepID=A0A7S7LZD4_9BACT|nr:MBL fold metallo-hydrolase [Candidatus Sulfurimonas marisnigri]QOY54257.1 MBL fold metallo-hydrolase [Candidatus Sulfurimonas marisnigri]